MSKHYQQINGINHNEGKPRPSLVLVDTRKAFDEVVKVAEFGCLKYSRDNWKAGGEQFQKDNQDSMMRNLLDYQAGKKVDDESGCHPLASLIRRAMMELELEIEDVERKGDLSEPQPENEINIEQEIRSLWDNFGFNSFSKEIQSTQHPLFLSTKIKVKVYHVQDLAHRDIYVQVYDIGNSRYQIKNCESDSEGQEEENEPHFEQTQPGGMIKGTTVTYNSDVPLVPDYIAEKVLGLYRKFSLNVFNLDSLQKEYFISKEEFIERVGDRVFFLEEYDKKVKVINFGDNFKINEV